MLPRSKRLSVSLFTNVLVNGKIVHSPLFIARILKIGDSLTNESRFSAVVSKKISKIAVERNKLRRRIYSAVRHLGQKVPPSFQIVLLAKPPLQKSSVKDITLDLESLFVKSGLIK